MLSKIKSANHRIFDASIIICMHAYLIIAHNEFEVLQKLIEALDDYRNDIYVHFDKKVKSLPHLEVKYSNLFICKKRINVHWGDISQLEAEYVLWQESYKQGKYTYYHLISGTHFPLKSQDSLHRFFDTAADKIVLQNMESGDSEVELKLRRVSVCVKSYNSENQFVRKLSQFIWKCFLRLHHIGGYKRNKQQVFKKSSTWCSLTAEAVAYMLSVRREVLRKYRYTFCGDEFFVFSELYSSPLKDKICQYDKLLKCDFFRTGPIVYNSADYEKLTTSNCLFARKFSASDLAIVDRLREHHITD